MSQRICAFGGCEAPLPTTKHASVRKYCSNLCRSKASYLRRRDEINSKKRAQRAAVRASVFKECPECEATFSPEKSLAQVYCSDPCLSRATRDSGSRFCGEPDCDRPMRAREMCAMHWRRWARATGREANPEWDERRRANWKKRYALTRGASDAESFDYREIYERDGWVCGICDEPVDRALAWPDPLSVSLDHIVPVSQGGAHSRENAQCAHLVCNVRKGDSLEAVDVSA